MAGISNLQPFLSAHLDHYFHIQERGSTPGTEIRAGVTTFLTMAYILFVNPQILAQAGMPAEDVAIATALSSALATLMMGLYAHLPFALAPGMGLNAYFTFGVVLAMGIPWQLALAAVFIEGLLFIILSLSRARTLFLEAIPSCLKSATMTGIGLFLAIIGLEQAGVVVAHPETLVTLGNLKAPTTLLALLGLIGMAVLSLYRMKGALLIGILFLTGTAWLTDLSPAPQALFSLPTLPHHTFLAFDLSHLLDPRLFSIIFAFLFVDFFDTAGTLLGVGKLGGFLSRKGTFPGAERAFLSDAVGTTLGAMLGTSTVTTYIESAAGIEEGGRTGLTAVVVGLLFLLALFLTPVFIAVPAFATAPALILIGAMMMQGTSDVSWTQLEEALPAFLTIVMMPFTYSITNGLVAGMGTYVLLKVLRGKAREVHPVLLLLTLILMVYYALS